MASGVALSGAAQAAPTKVADVNTTSLRAGIELGCEALGHLFNPNDTQVGAPYFWMNLRPGTATLFSDIFSDAQVPGKSLLGLLFAEELAGVSVDPRVVEQYARVAFFSYGGSVALPLNRASVGGRLVNLAPVNVAHGFHALYALATLRRSARAHELFEKSIADISTLWNPKSGWDRDRIGRLGLAYRDGQPDAPFIAGLAMAIGPLAKYYQATGSRSALDLATTLKDEVLAKYFLPDGDYDATRMGAHVQNVVYVMASLAWLATATRDASLMARVKAFYDNGLHRIRNNIGWSPEFFGSPAHVGGPRGSNRERGEAGNTALIVETALLLGDAGHPDAFADAELMLRSHLLPSQLRDVSCIVPSANLSGVNSSDAARRVRGTWGFPAPYGHLPRGDKVIGVGTDIVGPVVYTLAQAHSRIVDRRDGAVAVQLLFDYKSNEIEITPQYSSAAVTLTVRTAQPVNVRIPSWTAPASVEVTGVARESVAFANGYVRVATAPVNGQLTMRFPLSVREVRLSAGADALSARMLGDRVVVMENRGTDCTFFDPYATRPARSPSAA